MATTENDHPARALPEAERAAYLAAVAAVVLADGRAGEPELRRLDRLALALGLTTDSAARALLAARDPAHAHDPAFLAQMRERDLRFDLLRDVIVVAFADGRVALTEAREVAAFAAALGITPAQAVMLGRHVEAVVMADDAVPHDGSLGRDLASGMTAAYTPRPGLIRWLVGKLTHHDG